LREASGRKQAKKAWGAALSNKEFGALKRRGESFEKSPEGVALKHELD